MVEKRPALGRGLSALIPDSLTTPSAPAAAAATDRPHEIDTDLLRPNKFQPRTHLDEERIDELARSIKSNGVIQPIVVRARGAEYEIVAGERRWRAAQRAGLLKVPIVVRDVPDDRLLAVALIENIQREDLNPIETAIAFDRLGKELNLNAEEVGVRTGKDRSTVLNFTRLLQLPSDLQQLVAERRLSHGHARALLTLSNVEVQREVAEKAVGQGWSVRQTERVTQKLVTARQPKRVDEVAMDPNVKAALMELQRVLGTRVRIIEKPRKGGRIEIEYYSSEDLDRIYSTIVGDGQN